MEPRAQAYRVVTPWGSVAEVERYVAKLATWKVARGCPKENREVPPVSLVRLVLLVLLLVLLVPAQ